MNGIHILYQNLNQSLKLGGDIDGEEGGDSSGWSVSLSADGSRVAISAPGHDSLKGHVRIYEYS